MSLIIDVGDHSALDPNNTSGPPAPTLTSLPIPTITPTPTPSPHLGLRTGAKAGIGIGAGVGGLAMIVLASYLIRRQRKKAMQRAEKGENSSTSKPPPVYEIG